jgi:hypothetical protein
MKTLYSSIRQGNTPQCCANNLLNLTSTSVIKKLTALLAFVLMCSGVWGQVNTLTNWTNLYNNTGDLASGAVTMPAGSGNYRMLIVGIASSRSTVGARTATVTYGTQTLMLAAGNMALTTTRQHTAIYYLNEAGIDAAGASPTLAVTFGGGTARVNTVWYSVYDYVDQASPITNNQNYNSITTGADPFVFANALALNYDDQAIEVISSLRSGNTTPRTITAYATNWTGGSELIWTTTDGVRNAVASRSISANNTTDFSSVNMSGNSLGSMTAISLNATTKQYRSNVASGNWGTLGTWQQSMDGGTTWVTATTIPASTDGQVTILNGHNVTVAGAATASSLTVNSGGILTNSSTLSVTGSINFSAGATYIHAQNGGTIPTATWNTTSTCTIGTGFTGTAPSGLTQSFGNFTMNVNQTLTLAGTLTVGNDLSISSGTIAATTNTINLTKDLVVAGSLTFTSGTINIGGNWTNNGGTFTPGTGTVAFNGTAAQAIGGSASTSFNNLTISNTSAAVSANINTNISGTLNLNGASTRLTPAAAVVFNNSAAAGTITGTGTAQVTRTAATPDFSSQYKFSTNTLTNLTVEYAVLTGGQTISPLSYGNLKLSNSTGINTAVGIINISGAFTSTSGGTLSTTHDITFNGTTACGGSINATAGTVIYATTATNVLAGTYNNLTTNGAVTLCGDITVNGTLTLGGQLNTNGYNITLNGAPACGSGSVNALAGTITYNNTASNILPGTYYNLSLTSGITANFCTGNTTVSNAFTINGNTLNINAATVALPVPVKSGVNTININTGSLSVNGNLSLGATENITFSGNGALNVNGNLTCGTLTGNAGTVSIAGSFTPGSFIVNSSTVNFSGPGTQTIPVYNYYNLTSSNIGDRILSNSSDIGVSGTFTPGSNSYTTTGSTINYNASGAQPVASFTYNNLTLSGSGTKSLAGAVTVDNNLAVSGTSTLASGIYQITGNATGNLTLGAGTSLTLGNPIDATDVLFPTLFTNITLDNASTVAYQNNDAQTVAALTYGNLTINGGGVKSIAGNTTVNGVLTLTNGNLLVDGHNLTLLNTPVGSFDGSHMIVTGSTGWLIKQGTMAEASMVYPIGTGSKYTPVTITGTAGATTGNIRIKAMDGINSHLTNGGPLAKYWLIETPDYTLNGGTVTFTWHGTEASGDPSSFSLAQWTGGPDWNKRAATYASNSLTHTLGNTIAGEWTCTDKAILYSYKTGPWNDENTWTTDPSGTELIGNRVPQADDRVVILDGYTVTLTADVTTTGNAVSVENGAFLDMAGYRFTNGLVSLSGAGTIRSAYVDGSSVGYFPTAVSNTFINADGGTYEYTYNGASASFTLPTQATYNNLKINIGTGKKAVQTNNIILNGDLTVAQGTFQINNGSAASRSLTINGDASINGGASLTVGSGDAVHTITLLGNLTNKGTVNLTNNANYAVNTSGAANLVLTGTANAAIAINATTSFYGFVVNKGVDQSVVVEVSSDVATSPFDGNYASNVITFTAGTLKLNENIAITQLRAPVINGNFDIAANAALWVNGANITLGADALVVYGSLRMDMGLFNLMGGSQGAVVTREGGSLYINGGIFTANQLRPSNTDTHTGSYIQTGGTVNINGPATANTYPVFAWPFAASKFHMTGGTLNIRKPTASGTAVNGGLLIGVSPENYNITGGTVNIYVPASAINFNINSTAPLWNLNIYKEGAAGTGTVTMANQPHTMTGLTSPIVARGLTVLNDLTIDGTYSPTLNAGGQNVVVKGNFTINSGATYTVGTNNSTIFNGTAAQTFTNDGTITSGLYKLKVDKTAGTLTLAGTASAFTVTDSLIINKGTLANGGKTINVAGHIYNGGTHSGSGKIVMNSNALRTIEASTIGSPNLGNLEINNANGTAGFVATQLLSDVTVNALTLTSNHIFDIGVYGLTVNTNPIAGGSFSATKMIRTAGNASDKGLTLGISGSYAAGQTIATYPIGTGSNYTPAVVGANGNSGTLSGNHTVIPVVGMHPTAISVLGTYYVLSYYWKTKTTISGAINSAINVTFSGTTLTSPPSFGGGLYRPWLIDLDGASGLGNSVTSLANILFGGRGFLNSDYTIGATIFGYSPFNFNVRTLYSRNGATLPRNWNEADSWSTTGHDGGAAGSDPNAQDRLIIDNNHIVIVSGSGVGCATLSIGSGATLDLGTTTGHTFDVVTGTGKIRVSAADATANLPTGDMGAFLGSAGGTVEYYSTGTQDFTIPTKQGPTENLTPITGYRHLQLTPASGRYIAMPNSDLEIFGNMTVQGASSTGVARINTATAKTLQIDGNLSVSSGNLQFRSGTAQAVTVAGNVTVASGATFDVENDGTTNSTMSIAGNLTNNGTFDMRVASNCNVTFTGTGNTSITGTTAVLTDFNNLIINKGTSQTPTLTVDVNGSFRYDTIPANNWLTLSNGTFDYSNASALNLTTTSRFTIAQTACLRINNGSAVVTLANADVDDNDLFLNGKLQITAGTVNIGTSDNNNNNDIEYSSSTASELVVDGGTLFVNGQIRRSTTDLGGVLKYTQTAGAVTINGRKATTSRAKLEVLNSGSTFTLTGGSLTLVRGGGTTYGDLYLRPEAGHSTSAAGTITLATATGTGNQTFLVDANIPLSGLTVTSFDASNTATAKLNINPLVLTGGLTIGANSTFNTNNLNVTLAGNFSNSGTFTPGTNDVTTFNGATQTLSGNATFNNLAINPTTSVTLLAASDITINKTLSLLTGTFNDGGNTVTAKGSVYNDAAHVSTGAGKIKLNGTLLQTLTGNNLSTTALYGRLEVDNSAGAMLLKDASIANGLNLANGSVNINNSLLTMANGAVISPGTGAFNASRMIYSSGYITVSKGLTQTLPIGANEVLFPVGSPGKYTPVVFDYTQNSIAGTVNVIPINDKHITATDYDNVLQYYWTITSNGLTDFIGDVILNYLDSDVKVTDTNTEAQYQCARLIGAGWTKNPDVIDATNNQATFNFTSAFSSITGDYTAGMDDALPATVPTYTSRKSGNWGDINSWTPTPTLGVPSGAIMVIDPAHTITLETNRKKAYRTTINGRLDVGNTIGHNLGTVSGTGTLAVTDQKLPAGKYDAFFACGSGSLECGDGGIPKDYTISSIPTTLNQLILTGSGKRVIPNKDLTICGKLDIQGTATLDNSVNNRTLTLKGNFLRASGAEFLSGSGNMAKISFQGSTTQQVSGFSGSSALNHIEMNGSGGVNLSDSVEVKGNLTLTNGVITTSDLNILKLLSSTATITPNGGSATSYVSGAMSKRINIGSSIKFPIGHAGRYQPVEVNNVSATGTWVVEYNNHNPANDAKNPNSLQTPALAYVSHNEYWRIKPQVDGSIADITLNWDANSGVNPDNSFRVVKWKNETTPVWSADDITIVSKTGTASSGSVSLGALTFGFNSPTDKNHYLTFGTITIPIGIWEGDVPGDQTNWFNAGNWSDNMVPTAASNLTISNTVNKPIIKGTIVAQANNININHTSATLTLDAGAKLTVNGNINNIGRLILVHKPSAPSSFIHYGTITDGLVTGNTEVQREFDGSRSWYIGNCIENVPYSTFSGATPAPTPATGLQLMYSYDTNNKAWIYPSGADLLENMTGYAVNFGTATSYSMTQTGKLLTGDQTKGVVATGDKWNLLSNPFPAYVDFSPSKISEWVIDNIDPSLYVRTRINGISTYYTVNLTTGISIPSGLTYLAPMQAFFVKAQNTGDFTIKSTARINPSSTATLKAAELKADDVLRLTAANAVTSDETVIAFKPIGSESSSNIDSEKKIESASALPQIFSVKSTKNIAINVMPEDPTPYTIPLAMSVGSKGVGTTTLTASNITEFKPDINVYLRDLETGTETNLRQSPSYTFTITSAVTAKKRFELFFEKAPQQTTGTDVSQASDAISITAFAIDNKAIVRVNDNAFAGNVTIELFDATGKLINNQISAQKRTEIEMTGNTQMVIVKVTYKNLMKSFKLLKTMNL